MSHRVIIINALTTVFSDPDVRAEMTPQQCGEVDAILQCEEPTVQQVRELAHRMVRAYKKDD